MCVCVCVSTVSAATCNKVSTKRYLRLQRNMGNSFIMVFSLKINICYICLCKHLYIYIYIYVCICMYMYMYCICVCAHVHVHVIVCIHLCAYVCVNVCAYVLACACMCITTMSLRAFICVCERLHLRLRSFASNVRDQPRACTCVRTRVRACGHAYVRA